MKKILWIEDEGTTSLLEYKRPLVRAGYSVDIANTITDGIHLLTESIYDVLIFDLIIQCGDSFKTKEEYPGLEFIRRIKNNQISNIATDYDTSYFIVFSVVTDKKIMDDLNSLGVHEIVNKSMNRISDLKKVVEKIRKHL